MWLRSTRCRRLKRHVYIHVRVETPSPSPRSPTIANPAFHRYGIVLVISSSAQRHAWVGMCSILLDSSLSSLLYALCNLHSALTPQSTLYTVLPAEAGWQICRSAFLSLCGALLPRCPVSGARARAQDSGLRTQEEKSGRRVAGGRRGGCLETRHSDLPTGNGGQRMEDQGYMGGGDCWRHHRSIVWFVWAGPCSLYV